MAADTASIRGAKRAASGNSPELPSAFSLFGPSWEAVQVNLEAFAILALLIPLAILGVGGILCLAFSNTHAILYTLLAVLAVTLVAYWLVAAPGLVYAQLQSVRKTKVGYQAALEKGRSLVWPFLGLSLLVGLIIIIGFILLIVPGFFMIKRYLLAPYFLVDKNMEIKEAMAASVEVGKQNGGAIWGLLGVEIVISLVSSVPFIGSLISLILSVVYYCAPAIRYDQVKALAR